MGKDKDKSKKDKHKKSSKRHRDDSDSEEDRQRKSRKLADRVVAHLQKKARPAAEDAPGGAFVWKKKVEKQLQDGASVRDLTAAAEHKRQEDREREIEKVRKRRADRELEKAQMEEEQAMLARERAYAENLESVGKEEEFHLDQAKLRAARRLREGRPKPIDQLVRLLHLADEFGVDSDAPHLVFDRLGLADARELEEAIEHLQDLDAAEQENRDFWGALATVAKAQVAAATRQDEVDRHRMRGEPPPDSPNRHSAGLHGAVAADLDAQLAGKTLDELLTVEVELLGQLSRGEAADPEFTAAVLAKLTGAKARAQLREIHAARLTQHVHLLEARADPTDMAAAMHWNEDVDGDADGAAEGLEPSEAAIKQEQQNGAVHPATDAAAAPSREDWEESDEEFGEENVGQWSPQPVAAAEIRGLEVVSQAQDERMLQLLRTQVRLEEARRFRPGISARGAAAGDAQWQEAARQDINGLTDPMMRFMADQAPQSGDASIRPHVPSAEDRQMQAISDRLMGDAAEQGDISFGGEVSVEAQVYWWHDKYRPRKPRYFNRVHTGYEWNKYNQTHYDHDNPPPKVVQGYKFNIFYSDLIEKAEAPTYALDKDPHADEHGSTCLLRFHAGPPYEDIAFRIINKEWEYSHKKGFKCTFERGIMHLYFNFKRQRYRR